MARTLTREQLRAMFAAQRGGEISLSSRDTKLNREAEKVGATIHAANEEARKRNDVILARMRNDSLTPFQRERNESIFNAMPKSGISFRSGKDQFVNRGVRDLDLPRDKLITPKMLQTALAKRAFNENNPTKSQVRAVVAGENKALLRTMNQIRNIEQPNRLVHQSFDLQNLVERQKISDKIIAKQDRLIDLQQQEKRRQG